MKTYIQKNLHKTLVNQIHPYINAHIHIDTCIYTRLYICVGLGVCITLGATGVYPGMQSGWFNHLKSAHAIHHINSLKNENNMIISTDVQKAFGKIQYPFMVKLSSN